MSDVKRGLLFVISGPAGVGKTTLVGLLTEEFSHVIRSVSCTTRQARPGEHDGKDYFFLTEKAFKKKLESGDFLEHVTLFGASYGTSASFVEQHLKAGKHVVLVIDTQGALQLKAHTEAIFIFILPPSLEQLKKRLLHRRTESSQQMEERWTWAKHELEIIGEYDYHIVNDDLKAAYGVLKSILIAEEHRSR